jgi:UDPglucose 6-dehydrogenase
MHAELPALERATVAVIGLSFKPNTDDVREAPALKLIGRLLAEGARVHAYDPVALENVRRLYGTRVVFFEDPYAALSGAHALVIVTEWNEFRVLDLDKIKELLREPIVFDCRNIYEPETMAKKGFRYHSFGRMLE